MPVISRFHGITIAMYFYDHNPPHFHARYAGCKAIFSLDGVMMDGKLPRRAVRIVLEWLDLHRPELENNWYKACIGQPLDYIAALE